MRPLFHRNRGKIHISIIVSALGLIGIICIGNALAAGAPSRPSSSTKSAAQIRSEANVYFKQGEVLQDEGNYKEAAKRYSKAIKIDREYAEAYSNLGYCQRKQGQFKKAIKTYKKAIKLNPQLAEAHEYLGEAYAEIGKFDLAQQELQILRELGSPEADELAEFIEKMKKES